MQFDWTSFIKTYIWSNYAGSIALIGGSMYMIPFAITLLVRLFTKGDIDYVSHMELDLLNPYRFGTKNVPFEGPFFGKWYFGWQCQSASNEKVNLIWWLGHPQNINVFESIPIMGTDEPPKIKRRFVSTGSGYGDGTIMKPSVVIPGKPYEWQTDIIKRMREHKGNCIALLTGAPGTGKSFIAEYLAESCLDESDVDIVDIDPFRDNTTNMHFKTMSSAIHNRRKYIIFVIDEIDCVLEQIFTKKDPGRGYCTLIKQGGGKPQWNSFMDDLHRNCEKITVYTVLTSNRTRQEIIDECLGGDSAPLRDNRIDIYHEISPVGNFET